MECTVYARLVNKKCVYIEPDCKNQTATGCAECNNGSTLIQGRCYRTSDLEFYYPEPNCLTWYSGKCVQCKLGWQLFDEQCHMPLSQLQSHLQQQLKTQLNGDDVVQPFSYVSPPYTK